MSARLACAFAVLVLVPLWSGLLALALPGLWASALSLVLVWVVVLVLSTPRRAPWGGFPSGVALGVALGVLARAVLVLVSAASGAAALGRALEPPTLALVAFAAIGGALVEEVYFRGALQPHLQALYGRWPGLLMTAALFSLVHLPLGQAFGVAVVTPVLVTGVLGVGLGVLRMRFSMSACVSMHLVFNLLGVGVSVLASL